MFEIIDNEMLGKNIHCTTAGHLQEFGRTLIALKTSGLVYFCFLSLGYYFGYQSFISFTFDSLLDILM
jgi:hypothetical protein